MEFCIVRNEIKYSVLYWWPHSAQSQGVAYDPTLLKVPHSFLLLASTLYA